MTVRPILFSAPMIKALLDGRKTQTRRLLRWQPTRVLRLKAKPDDLNLSFSGLRPERLRTNGTPDGVWRLVSRGRGGCWEERARVRTYATGDLLWVRESWWHVCAGDGNSYRAGLGPWSRCGVLRGGSS